MIQEHKKATIDWIIYALYDNEKTAEIIGNDDISGDIIIPRSINYESQEYLVTNISKYSFFGANINSVCFPSDSDVKKIGEYAFSSSQIQKVTF